MRPWSSRRNPFGQDGAIPGPSGRTLLVLLLVASLLVVAGIARDRSPFAPASAQPEFAVTAATYAGEVAIEDGAVQLRGIAPGANTLVFVLVDSTGATVATTGTTTPGGSFTENVPLAGTDRPLAAGPVRAFVLSAGSDQMFGTGRQQPTSTRQLELFVDGLGTRGLSRDAVVDELRAATWGARNSDDREASTEFTLARANTRITRISGRDPTTGDVSQFQPGENVVLSGTTNRRPDRNNVRVRVTRGPSAGQFGSPVATQWGSNGDWSVRLPVPPNANSGRYAVTAEDGASNDTVQFEVVRQRGRTTRTRTTTTTTTATPTTTETTTTTTTTTTTATTTTTTTTATTTTTTTTTTTPTSILPGQPGFGVLVAVVALLLALLVRVRAGGSDP